MARRKLSQAYKRAAQRAAQAKMREMQAQETQAQEGQTNKEGAEMAERKQRKAQEVQQPEVPDIVGYLAEGLDQLKSQTTSGRIRELLQKGYSVRQIAKALGVRYQFVYNVAKREEARKAKAEQAEEPKAEEQGRG